MSTGPQSRTSVISTGLEHLETQLATQDPLKPFRNLLKAGTFVYEFGGGARGDGAKRHRHLCVSTDWTKITIKERPANSSGMFSAAGSSSSGTMASKSRTILIRHLRKVEKGLGPGHYKKSLLTGSPVTDANERHSFFVTGLSPDDAFHITCEANGGEGERDQWIKAFEMLIAVSKKCPEKLAPQ